MFRDFVFRVQPVLVSEERAYQLRVGMYGERELDFIPAHKTAFAQRFPLKELHASEDEAHREEDALLAWLRAHTAGPNEEEQSLQ